MVGKSSPSSATEISGGGQIPAAADCSVIPFCYRSSQKELPKFSGFSSLSTIEKCARYTTEKLTKVIMGKEVQTEFILKPSEKAIKNERDKMVGARGFEPPTPDTPCQCATRLRYAPMNHE